MTRLGDLKTQYLTDYKELMDLFVAEQAQLRDAHQSRLSALETKYDADLKKAMTELGVHQYEVCFSVSQFYSEKEAQKTCHSEERDRAFEDAESSLGEKHARMIFLKEVVAQKGGKVKILGIEFVEFDSSNVSHACAYWSVTYSGKALAE